MSKTTLSSVLGIVVPLILATILCVMMGSGGSNFMQFPVFSICVGIAFTSQWMVFLPSYWYRTEKFFDLNGSATYLILVFSALVTASSIQARSVLIGILVSIWAIRLGGFLFSRIRQTGHDSRFVNLKSNFLTFLMVWTLQGLWITLTFAAGLGAMTSGKQGSLDMLAICGLILWLVGFAVEVTADNQKKNFRSAAGNKNAFISHGLWSWSRHPNYFGEILLWVGITVIAFPTMTGLGYVTLVSPLFVLILLSKVSGIPLLEKQADQRWGSDPEYVRYKSVTPVLFPNPFKNLAK
jgi:steroid 5-alpha reductase family enzyme